MRGRSDHRLPAQALCFILLLLLVCLEVPHARLEVLLAVPEVADEGLVGCADTLGAAEVPEADAQIPLHVEQLVLPKAHANSGCFRVGPEYDNC